MNILRIATFTLLLGVLGLPCPARSETDARKDEGRRTQADASPKPAGGTPCRPNYWIVSARDCPQDGGARCVGCHFDVFHFQACRGLRRSSLRDFREALQPRAPVCIVVHGSFVDWPTIRAYGQAGYQWLRRAAPRRPLHLVFFTWPSEGFLPLVPLLDVELLGRRSAFNGLHLAEFAATIPRKHPISLIGHSHGARTVASTLHLMGGGSVQGYSLSRDTGRGRRVRAVLAAAALDHPWFNPGNRYGCALRSVETLVHLRNRNDLPLLAYPLRKPFSHRALARAGFTRDDLARLGPQAAKIVEFDITPLVGSGHIWPNYYTRPEIAAAIAPYIYFADSRSTE